MKNLAHMQNPVSVACFDPKSGKLGNSIFLNNFRLLCSFRTLGLNNLKIASKLTSSFPSSPKVPSSSEPKQKLSNNFEQFSQTMGLRIRLYRVVLNCSNNYFATLPGQGAVSRGQAFQVHLRKDWNRMAANARSAAKSIIVLNRFKI